MRFAEQYALLLKQCLDPRESVEELNQRTGSRIRAIPAGASFVVDLWDNVLPTCGLRRTRPHIAAAEAAWCFIGHAHVDWLRKWTRVWDDFADVTMCAKCDGGGWYPPPIDAACSQSGAQITCDSCDGSGKTYWLEQAYGNRWRVSLGIDQLAIAIKRLQDDPTDRRVWISSWDPSVDILPLRQKTVPCPVGFTLSTLNGRLNSTLMIRSSDLYMGLPYDVMRHALVMAAAARSIGGVSLGRMRVTLAHPHLYERHYGLTETMIGLEPVVPFVTMPTWSVEDIVRDPDHYVVVSKEQCHGALFPWFDPKSEVVH